MREYELTINKKSLRVRVKEFSADQAELEVNGKPYTVNIDKVTQPLSPGAEKPPLRSVSSAAQVTAPAAPQAPSAAAGSVRAPIPGSILDIFVKVGDAVKAGQPLFKMEAMKMENEINAQTGGSVSAILVSPGDSVSQGQELIQISPA